MEKEPKKSQEGVFDIVVRSIKSLSEDAWILIVVVFAIALVVIAITYMARFKNVNVFINSNYTAEIVALDGKQIKRYKEDSLSDSVCVTFAYYEKLTGSNRCDDISMPKHHILPFIVGKKYVKINSISIRPKPKEIVKQIKFNNYILYQLTEIER